jgi:predicted ATPase
MHSVVLTGGDHSGKTTLLEALRAEGYAVVGEAALGVIEELNRELGIDAQRSWRDAHWARFQARVARRQHELERAARDSGARALVLDRGLPDGIAFCRLAGVAVPDELREGLERRYDHVLLLDTVTPFAARPETGRIGGLERSRALRDLLRSVYEELGYAPEPLALLPVGERIAHVRALLR